MARTRPLPAALIFDIDGTLVDTHRLYLEAYRRAVAPNLGYSPTDDEIRARKPLAERRFLEEWVGAEAGSRCHDEMCRHYRELHASLCDGIYEGVREMLAGLRSAGLRMAVVTGKGRAAWEVTTAAMDLGTFEVVVTEEDVDEPKPDPAGLLLAAEGMGIAPADLAYIGDSVGDIAAARGAGMGAGAVLWPKEDPSDREDFLTRLESERPDWVFERPADVVRAFAGWCGVG